MKGHGEVYIGPILFGLAVARHVPVLEAVARRPLPAAWRRGGRASRVS